MSRTVRGTKAGMCLSQIQVVPQLAIRRGGEKREGIWANGTPWVKRYPLKALSDVNMVG